MYYWGTVCRYPALILTKKGQECQISHSWRPFFEFTKQQDIWVAVAAGTRAPWNKNYCGMTCIIALQTVCVIVSVWFIYFNEWVIHKVKWDKVRHQLSTFTSAVVVCVSITAHKHAPQFFRMLFSFQLIWVKCRIKSIRCFPSPLFPFWLVLDENIIWLYNDRWFKKKTTHQSSAGCALLRLSGSVSECNRSVVIDYKLFTFLSWSFLEEYKLSVQATQSVPEKHTSVCQDHMSTQFTSHLLLHF